MVWTTVNLHRSYKWEEWQKRDQLELCIRWVSERPHVHEKFIGSQQLSNAIFEHIFFGLKDTLLKMNLKLESVHDQCYDGVASMRSRKFSLWMWIKCLNEKIWYTNYCTHILNCAAGNFIESVPSLHETFGTSYEICKFLKTVTAKKALN